MPRNTVTYTPAPPPETHPPLLFRLIWFLIVGWWLGSIVGVFAFLFTIGGGIFAWDVSQKLWRMTSRCYWL